MKTEADRRFWPFKPQTSIAWSVAMLAGLLFILLVLKRYDLWQISEKSDSTVLIGLLLVSLLPVVLAVLDVIIERGGAIGYGDLRIDFSQAPQTARSEFSVPTNIGVPGEAVTGSTIPEILDPLSDATNCEVVVIDLKEGQAWWETRLLVLLAGAERLGRPDKVVFVGKDGGVDRCFQGWGYSKKLLTYLLDVHPQYQRSYHAARAAGRQWELVEPVNPPRPSDPTAAPSQPPWMQKGLATNYPDIRFDQKTGLPNPFLAEQLMALDLGDQVENHPTTINFVRLRKIFKDVLYKPAIDTSWPTERQITEFFESDSSYLAITQKGAYVSLTSRLSVLNAFVSSIAAKRQA